MFMEFEAFEKFFQKNSRRNMRLLKFMILVAPATGAWCLTSAINNFAASTPWWGAANVGAAMINFGLARYVLNRTIKLSKFERETEIEIERTRSALYEHATHV